MADLKFISIRDEALVSRVLHAAARAKTPVTFWLREQTVKFDAAFAAYYQHFKRLLVRMASAGTERTFLDAASTREDGEIMGSFQLHTLYFFFRTKLGGPHKEGTIQIEIPAELFKLQRRQSLRIPFLRKHAPKLTFFHPHKKIELGVLIKPEDILSFRVLDVSAGGLAFAATPEDKDLFHSGHKLRDLRFKIRGLEIVCNGSVTHAAEGRNDQGKPMLKVGVQFKDLKPQDEKHIVQFVLDESRSLFSLLH